MKEYEVARGVYDDATATVYVYASDDQAPRWKVVVRAPETHYDGWVRTSLRLMDMAPTPPFTHSWERATRSALIETQIKLTDLVFQVHRNVRD
jgi:hypothetical protein